MPARLASVLLWVAIWAAGVALAVACRPVLPVDETRYLSVAWEMWLRGDYLVPYLNGEAYHHKPPLLFWGMLAGWHLFGVVDWWPRLVAPLFALASLGLTWQLAGLLWPRRRLAQDLAPILLIGTVFWVLYQTLTMFDMLLAATALVALVGLLRAWRLRGWGGFVLAGFGLGLGVLAKGPAILLHVLPAALLAPLWATRLEEAPARPPEGWAWWYKGTGLAVGIGAVLGLAWAIPAGIAGGEEYRSMIFWGQWAGRIVESFDHGRPGWWYAAVLPALILPWLLWPRLWGAVVRAPGLLGDGGVRLVVVWFAVAFAAFSVISGKQPHYLLPEFPALALLAARLLAGAEGRDDAPRPSRLGLWPPAALPVVAGAGLLALPLIDLLVPLPSWAPHVGWWWGALPLAAGLALARFGGGGMRLRAGLLAVTSLALLATVHLGGRGVFDSAYDLAPLARKLKAYEERGYVLAHFGTYHSQYQFLGRLETPMTVIHDRIDQPERFLAAHARGLIVSYHEILPAVATPLMTHPFRTRTITVWDLKTVRAHPRVIYRDWPLPALKHPGLAASRPAIAGPAG